MKRRGFLGMLFGAPAAVVAGKVAAEAVERFPKGLLQESEPTPQEAAEVFREGDSWYPDMSCTVSSAPLRIETLEQSLKSAEYRMQAVRYFRELK
jgi:hypothetical protein